MAQSGKLLGGYLPSVHTSVPAELSGSQLTFCPWRGKIRSSKCMMGKQHCLPHVTQRVSWSWLTVCSPPAGVSPALSLFLTLLLERVPAPSGLLGFPPLPVHGSKPCICHILSSCADCFLIPTCSERLDVDLAVFEGQGELSFPLRCYFKSSPVLCILLHPFLVAEDNPWMID